MHHSLSLRDDSITVQTNIAAIVWLQYYYCMLSALIGARLMIVD